MGEGETFVGGGSFLIDRKRALEKLMRFQLPDACMYPLPWVQAALASGAKQVYVWPTRAGLELAFGGQPWDPAAVKDPYRHLFEEDPDGRNVRYRELAIGLLSVLRIQPQHVSLTFSNGGREYSLEVQSLEKETLEQLPGAPLEDERARFSSEVVMSIFVGKPLASFDKELRFLKDHCRHCPVPIVVKGEPVNPPPAPDAETEGRKRLRRRFAAAGAEGCIELVAEHLEASSIDVVTRGVTIATEHPQLPGVQVLGHVRNDSLRKSLSQMGTVKDETYQRTMDLVSAESVALLKDATARAWQLWRELRPGTVAASTFYWMPWIRPSLGEMFEGILWTPPEAEAAKETAKTLLPLSVCVAALRQACLFNRMVLLRGEAGVPETLWGAPIAFDPHGEPVTLRALEKQRLWLGYVPYVTSRRPGPDEVNAVWALRHLDVDFLEAFFPDGVRRLPSRLSADTPNIQPVLEEPNLLAKRPFEAEEICGEVGLSLSPHPKASRIRWLNGGLPLGQNVWKLATLRLEAVVSHASIPALPAPGSSDPAARDCLSAVLSASLGVYGLIAQEYKAAEETPRQGIIREHLLDLLAYAWDPSKQDCPSQPWLAELALFRTDQGRMVSLKNLREEAAQGRKSALLVCPHPDRLKPLFVGYPRHAKTLFQGSPLVIGVFDPDEKPAEPKPAQRPPALDSVSRPLAQTPPPAQLMETAQVAPPPPPPAQAPPPTAAQPAVQDLAAGPETELKRWLKALKQLNACPLSNEDIDGLRFKPEDSETLVRHGEYGWELNPQHALFLEIERHGEVLRHMPYLSSVFLSGLNRALPEVTDAEDERNTMALVDLLLMALARVRRNA